MASLPKENLSRPMKICRLWAQASHPIYTLLMGRRIVSEGQTRVTAMSIQSRRTPSKLSGLPGFAELLGRALMLAYGWRERSRQREALLRLDDRMLRDIGLSRADVDCEASKPFWRG
jgi:uncharacterized protein YjiS (DUF1127 family)